MTQCWISSNNKALLGIKYNTRISNPQVGALLVAGFGQPMCDADYFMSKLARRLASFGICVLQIDPVGHGDSQGNLEDVTLSSYYSDLKASAGYMLNFVSNVFCIGRGLSATLFSKVSVELPLLGVAGIEPYCVNGKEVATIWKDIKDNFFEVDEIIQGNIHMQGFDLKNEKVTFFGALGADVENLQGQRMSSRLINDLKEFDPYNEIKACKSKSHWILAKGFDSTEITIWKLPSEKKYSTVSDYSNISLPANSFWQHNAIESISAWVNLGA